MPWEYLVESFQTPPGGARYDHAVVGKEIAPGWWRVFNYSVVKNLICSKLIMAIRKRIQVPYVWRFSFAIHMILNVPRTFELLLFPGPNWRSMISLKRHWLLGHWIRFAYNSVRWRWKVARKGTGSFLSNFGSVEVNMKILGVVIFPSQRGAD